MKNETRTIVIQESKHRIIESLQDIQHVLGSSRKIVFVKELTKYWENFYRGCVSDILYLIQINKINIKGEIILIIEGLNKNIIENFSLISEEISNSLKLLLKYVSIKDAVLLTSKIFNINKNYLYKYILTHKI